LETFGVDAGELVLPVGAADLQRRGDGHRLDVLFERFAGVGFGDIALA
jgi:hypothetical protein